MKRKSVKIGYIVLIFSLLLAVLPYTVWATTLAPPSGAISPDATQGAAYTSTTTITASGGFMPGGQSYTWSIITGPTGITLTNSGINGSICQITGAPTGSAGNNQTLTIQACDRKNVCATGNYTITINPAVSLSPVSGTTFSPNATQYETYTSPVLTAMYGTAPYTWTATGLPTGLNLSSNSGGSITITGEPQVSGTFSFTVTVTDRWVSNASASYNLTINPGIVCTVSDDGKLVFGNIDAVGNSGGATASVTPPTVYCTLGYNYDVTSQGANGGIDKGTGYRLKDSGSNYIAYTLNYTTPIPGQGPVISIGGNLALSATIPAGGLDNAPAGTYTDTITLTISY